MSSGHVLPVRWTTRDVPWDICGTGRYVPRDRRGTDAGQLPLQLAITQGIRLGLAWVSRGLPMGSHSVSSRCVTSRHRALHCVSPPLHALHCVASRCACMLLAPCSHSASICLASAKQLLASDNGPKFGRVPFSELFRFWDHSRSGTCPNPGQVSRFRTTFGNARTVT